MPCDRGEAIALAERGRTEVLWGDRHVVLGEVGTASLEPRAALAISRGGQAKRYPYVDPNEDAVLAAAGPAGWLLAVADGHNGFDAARAALGAVEREAGRLLEQEGLDPTAAVYELFGAARKAVVAALAGAGRSRQASRTALSIALVVGGQVYGASLGDTVALRLGQEFEEIGAEGPFLGPGSRGCPYRAYSSEAMASRPGPRGQPGGRGPGRYAGRVRRAGRRRRCRRRRR